MGGEAAAEEEDGVVAAVDSEEEAVVLEEEAVDLVEEVVEVEEVVLAVGAAEEGLEDEAAVDLEGVGAVLAETGTVVGAVGDSLVTEIEIRIVMVILLYFLNIIYIFKLSIFRWEVGCQKRVASSLET